MIAKTERSLSGLRFLAVITEEVDNYGNTRYIIETERIEIYNEVSLADIAAIFLNDPTVEARLVGNTLFYTLPNGVEGTLTETIHRDGTRSLHSIEGEKDMVMVFDSVNEEILVDGEAVVVSATETFVIYQTDDVMLESGVAVARTNWVFWGEWRPDIQAERVISSATTTFILTLLTVALGPLGGVTVGLVGLVITVYQALNPQGRAIYVTRRTYVGGGTMRTVNRFYSNQRRTNFVSQTVVYTVD